MSVHKISPPRFSDTSSVFNSSLPEYIAAAKPVQPPPIIATSKFSIFSLLPGNKPPQNKEGTKVKALFSIQAKRLFQFRLVEADYDFAFNVNHRHASLAALLDYLMD